MTLRKQEYLNQINMNTFYAELDQSEKDLIDCLYSVAGNKLVVLWNDPVPQNITDSFQTKVDNHNPLAANPNAFKLYRYTSLGLNQEIEPHEIDFTTNLDIGLNKSEVTFDHKGCPSQVIYTYEGEEICKRTWEFVFFTVENIMSILSVDQPTAEAMADDLIWQRKEYFHWIKENGNYSPNIKTKIRDYVPFVGGVPDISKFYVERKFERIQGRDTVMQGMEPYIVQFIMNGASIDLNAARVIGTDFLKTYAVEFDSYIKSGDEAIETIIINDIVFPFLNYATDIQGVNCRQWIVNKLRQLPDLSTPL